VTLVRGLAILVVLAACGEPAPSTLVIERASPAYGPLSGGTRIEISGSGFSSSAASSNRVMIGGRVAPLVATIDDATLEVVIPPADQPGDAEIVVFNDSRNASATGVFRYSTPPAITSISPDQVLFSSTSTTLTVTGTGFLEEGAGTPQVLIDGQPTDEVDVTSDTSLTLTAPPGAALASPDLTIINARGSAFARRAFRYLPGERGGLLLFPPSASAFAVFFDPVDNSTVTIPRRVPFGMRFTAVVRDEHGDFWAIDRNQRVGWLDLATQTIEAPIPISGVIPALVREGSDYFAIHRGGLGFGKLDLTTGAFTPIGGPSIPCCGSYGLASDGATLYFTARAGANKIIATIDRTTGEAGPAVTITAGPGFHVEDMRFFAGALYASSRDGTLVTIDPATGTTTVLPVSLGRFNAMEVFP
jgi:hypothetical protein